MMEEKKLNYFEWIFFIIIFIIFLTLILTWTIYVWIGNRNPSLVLQVFLFVSSVTISFLIIYLVLPKRWKEKFSRFMVDVFGAIINWPY